jgi:hypothetical protein
LDSIQFFNDKQREEWEKEVIFGIPSHLRGKFWKVCTGYEQYKNFYCDEYYETLQMAIEFGKLPNYPNPHFKQIEKDMTRTFVDDPFYTQELQDSIKRILTAYIWRNPTVGYI